MARVPSPSTDTPEASGTPAAPAPVDSPQAEEVPSPDTAAPEETPKAEVPGEPEAAPEAEPEAEPEEEEAAPEEEPAEVPEDTTLDDETISALSDAYGDKLLQTKSIKDAVAAQVKQEVRRQVEDATRGADAQNEVTALIERAKQAVVGIAQAVGSAKTELEKAQRGEEFSTSTLEPEKLEAHLRDYGSAIVADAARTYDTAIERGFDEVFSEVLPQLTDEQAEELAGIAMTYERMKGDPRQSPKATDYFVNNLFRFVASRATEHGTQAERDRLAKSRTVREKIASKNAVTAAKADLAKEKVPPQAPASAPREGGYTQEDYDKAKDAGDYDRAQDIADAMSRRVLVTGV